MMATSVAEDFDLDMDGIHHFPRTEYFASWNRALFFSHESKLPIRRVDRDYGSGKVFDWPGARHENGITSF